MYIHIHIYTYICIYECIYKYIHTYIHTYICSGSGFTRGAMCLHGSRRGLGPGSTPNQGMGNLTLNSMSVYAHSSFTICNCFFT